MKTLIVIWLTGLMMTMSMAHAKTDDETFDFDKSGEEVVEETEADTVTPACKCAGPVHRDDDWDDDDDWGDDEDHRHDDDDSGRLKVGLNLGGSGNGGLALMFQFFSSVLGGGNGTDFGMSGGNGGSVNPGIGMPSGCNMGYSCGIQGGGGAPAPNIVPMYGNGMGGMNGGMPSQGAPAPNFVPMYGNGMGGNGMGGGTIYNGFNGNGNGFNSAWNYTGPIPAPAFVPMWPQGQVYNQQGNPTPTPL